MAIASRWFRTAAVSACVVVAGATAVVSSAAAGVVEANLKVVGRSASDNAGGYGAVTVVGTTAVVAPDAPPPPGPPCPASAARVVDIKDPRKPRLVGSVPLPPGMTVADLDSIPVHAPAFTGALVAFALAPLGSCAESVGHLIDYYDVTDPANPRAVARSPGCRRCGPGPSSVSLAQRGDGRVIAAGVDTSGTGVAVDDVTDPAHPAPLGGWRPPPGPGGCATAALAPAGGASLTVQLHDDGEAALAVLADGRTFDLDLLDPAHPFPTSDPYSSPGGWAGARGAVLPLVRRTVAIVAEDRLDGRCLDALSGPGLRVLALERGAAPGELEPVGYPGPDAPGRLVATGALAYVAWHGAGVRVVDFGEVRARTVARFVPSEPDVVGVALLPEHIVVVDRTSGLYVLERPDEGGGRATFWSQFLSILPYMGFAVVAAAALVVPRAMAAWAGVGGGSLAPSPEKLPVPAPVPRRRA